jgi:hypothetical protein
MLKFDSYHPSGRMVPVYVNLMQIVAVSPDKAGTDDRHAVLILGNGTALKVNETVDMVLARLQTGD